MSEPAVQIQDLGKKFDIGIARHKSLGQQIRYWIRGHHPVKSFWALRNVAFDVGHGEAFGIIGPNGAGKTTLLRMIAGILQPNEGDVAVEGRVNPFLSLGGSLLSELTVLENLRLNSALLGYSREEFEAKLDAILEFSELHDYLYAAVADLSSGWSARVGFSVAVHSNLNILLVDETMEVRDIHFKRKCRAKFKEILKEGKTLILTSHSLPDVKEICNRALYLDGGRPRGLGEADAVVQQYQDAMEEKG